MLVLTRKPKQSFRIGDDIVITVVSVQGEQVRLGIEAPRDLAVLRQELYEDVGAANAQAARTAGIENLSEILKQIKIDGNEGKKEKK
jgi:carbon storage regulator